MKGVLLGISSSHDASACVFVDGELKAAISEERLTRVKCDGGRLPELAIDRCLAMAGAVRRDVDAIAMTYNHVPEEYCRRTSARKEIERRLSRALKKFLGRPNRSQYFLSEILRHLRRTPGAKFEDYFFADCFLAGEGFRPGIPIQFVDHHLTHAVAAAWYSGFPSAAVLTMDGEGDLDMHHTSSAFAGGRLHCLHVSDTPGNSPGYFYMSITELLGFMPLRHEGKVLGLAAFGDPAPLRDALRRALRLSSDGAGFDSDFAGREGALDRRHEYLARTIAGHSREDVASAAQQVFEEAIVALARNFLRESGERRLALNGGVFANVKLNQRLAALPEADSVFVFPAMSDAGNSVGAALAVLDRLEPGHLAASHEPLRTVYWGPEFGTLALADELRKRGFEFQSLGEGEILDKAAQAIHAGRVVGWFQGRMEFGPRALGNRSMLARPTDAAINKSLNARLERTEFMPFAPSVLDEHADGIFENVAKARHTAEFMTITFDVRQEWRARIPAVVHVDGTARPQLVRRDRNPLYWALIERYRQLSGIPLVLNTSFNVHEEPIVCAPAEAAQALADERIDALALGPFWAEGRKR